jgi:hypothetical protein
VEYNVEWRMSVVVQKKEAAWLCRSPDQSQRRCRPLFSHAINYGAPVSSFDHNNRLRRRRLLYPYIRCTDIFLPAFLPSTRSGPCPAYPWPRPVLTLCILRCFVLTPLALSHKTLYSSILPPHANPGRCYMLSTYPPHLTVKLASLHLSPARKCEYQKAVARRSPHRPGIGFRCVPSVSSPGVFTHSMYPVPAPSTSTPILRHGIQFTSLPQLWSFLITHPPPSRSSPSLSAFHHPSAGIH